jgi:hypothetical protein
MNPQLILAVAIGDAIGSGKLFGIGFPRGDADHQRHPVFSDRGFRRIVRDQMGFAASGAGISDRRDMRRLHHILQFLAGRLVFDRARADGSILRLHARIGCPVRCGAGRRAASDPRPALIGSIEEAVLIYRADR